MAGSRSGSAHGRLVFLPETRNWSSVRTRDDGTSAAARLPTRNGMPPSSNVHKGRQEPWRLKVTGCGESAAPLRTLGITVFIAVLPTPGASVGSLQRVRRGLFLDFSLASQMAPYRSPPPPTTSSSAQGAIFSSSSSRHSDRDAGKQHLATL